MAKKRRAGRGGPRAGAGRPQENPEGKKVTLAATVPEGLVSDLKAIAAAKGWSASRAVTEAVRVFVRSHQALSAGGAPTKSG